MERGDNGKSGGTLLSYWQYADYLSLSLQPVFTEGLDHYLFVPEEWGDEQRYAAQLNHLVSHLRAVGEPVDDRNVYIWMGVNLKKLRSYPTTDAILRQLKTEDYLAHEDALLEQVEDVIQMLQTEGKPVYREDIYRHMGMRSQKLRSYPRIHARLFPLNRTSPGRKPTRVRLCEETLLARTQQIVETLIEQRQPVIQTDIAAALGMSLTHIHRAYPTVYAFLRTVRTIRTEQIETELLDLVEQAIQNLQLARQTVTRKAVAEHLEVSVATLDHYPRVRDHLKQICDEQIARQKAQRVARITEAIAVLQTRGEVLTQTTICEQAGFNESAARQHAEIQEVIAPVLAAQEAQQRQQLMHRVAEVITQLRQQGDKVVMPAVCRLVGMSLAGLRQYPEAVEQVRQARQEQRDDYEAALVARIEQAIVKLKRVGRPLTQKAICEVITFSPNSLRNYSKAKAVVDAVASRYHRKQHTAWHERYSRSS